MKKTICVKFNKVENYWTVADIMRIQLGMKCVSCKGLRKSTFEQMDEIGYGYAFLGIDQILSVKNDYLLVDSKGNVY